MIHWLITVFFEVIEPYESVLLIISSLEFIFFIYLIIFSQFVLHFYNSKIVCFDCDLHQSTVKKKYNKKSNKKNNIWSKICFAENLFRKKIPLENPTPSPEIPFGTLLSMDFSICGKSPKEILSLTYFFKYFLWVLWLGFELHYWIEKQNILVDLLVDLKLGISANHSCELSKDSSIKKNVQKLMILFPFWLK